MLLRRVVHIILALDHAARLLPVLAGLFLMGNREDVKREHVVGVDFFAIRQGLDTYWAQKRKYPGDEGLEALVRAGVFEKLAIDPWGHEYVYERRGEMIRITSRGKDGIIGGDGVDADLELLIPAE